MSHGDDAAPLGSRLGTLAFVYAFFAAPSAVAALSFASAATRALGPTARGDAVLWDDGGMWLVDFVQHLRVAERPLTTALPWALFAWSALSLVPLAVLIAALARRGRVSAAVLAAVAIARLGPLALVAAACFVLRALVLLVGVALFVIAPAVLGPNASERASMAISCVAAAFGVALFSLASLLRDLAQSACVAHDAPPLGAFAIAFTTLHDRLRPLVVRYLAAAFVQLLVVGAAGFGAGALGVETRERVVAVGLTHQLALVTLVVARAWWLRAAIVGVGGEPPDDRDVGSDPHANGGAGGKADDRPGTGPGLSRFSAILVEPSPTGDAPGCEEALNLDGGPSTGLFVRDDIGASHASRGPTPFASVVPRDRE